MEYVLKEEAKDINPYIYSYKEVKEYAEANYGIKFIETKNPLIIEGQKDIISWVIDSDFITVESWKENYSYIESMIDYEE